MLATSHVASRRLCLRYVVAAAVSLLVSSAYLAMERPGLASASTVLIDFESDSANSAGSSNSFSADGVDFAGGQVVDFSNAPPTLGHLAPHFVQLFAHSPSHAVMVCEFDMLRCGLTMTLPTDQAEVRLWVAFATGRTNSSDRTADAAPVPQQIEVQAFDANRTPVAGAKSGSTANGASEIDEELVLTSTSGAIHSVTVRPTSATSGVLTVDDVTLVSPRRELKVAPEEVDYGPAQGRIDQPRTVNVRNTGNVVARVVTAGVFGAAGVDVVGNDCRKELLPGAICTLIVQGRPDATLGPNAALVLRADTPVGRYSVRLVAIAAPTTTSTRPPPTDGVASGPIEGGGSDGTLRTVAIVAVVVVALASLAVAGRLLMRPSTPLRVVVRPAPTSQRFGSNEPPTTVSVRFDPSTGTVQWIDRSRE